MYLFTAWIIVLIFLIFNTFTDVRYQKILTHPAIGMIILGIVLHILLPKQYVITSILGMLPGAVLLGVAFLNGKAIGIGDGLVICGIGSMLGIVLTFRVTMLSLFFAAVWALLLITRKVADRHTKMPYMPFLLCGFLFSLLF